MWKYSGKELVSLKSLHGELRGYECCPKTQPPGSWTGHEIMSPCCLQRRLKVTPQQKAKREGFPAAASPIWTKILDPLTLASLLWPGGASPIPKSFALGTVRWDNGKEKKKNAGAWRLKNKRSEVCIL